MTTGRAASAFSRPTWLTRPLPIRAKRLPWSRAAFAEHESQVENVVLRIHAGEEPPHGATADFDLVTLAREQEAERQRWSLSIKFVFLPEVPRGLVIWNPMGIMITYLQADRALVTGQKNQ